MTRVLLLAAFYVSPNNDIQCCKLHVYVDLPEADLITKKLNDSRLQTLDCASIRTSKAGSKRD